MGGSTKQALLQALSAAEGAYISGQQLAEALGVSRAAVHKAAQALSAPDRGIFYDCTFPAPHFQRHCS